MDDHKEHIHLVNNNILVHDRGEHDLHNIANVSNPLQQQSQDKVWKKYCENHSCNNNV